MGPTMMVYPWSWSLNSQTLVSFIRRLSLSKILISVVFLMIYICVMKLFLLQISNFFLFNGNRIFHVGIILFGF